MKGPGQRAIASFTVALCGVLAAACGKAESDKSNQGDPGGVAVGASSSAAGSASAAGGSSGSGGSGTGGSGTGGAPNGVAGGGAAAAAGAASDGDATGGAATEPGLPAPTVSYWKFGGVNTDEGEAIGVDASENVYVAGVTKSWLTDVPPSEMDSYVRKYDAQGNELWTRQWGKRGPSGAHSLAVDADGNVYAAGGFNGSDPGGEVGAYHQVIKYDPSGRLIWGQATGLAANIVALDVSHNVYLAGRAEQDLGVQKYDAKGEAQWALQFEIPNLYWVNGLAVDATGQSYLAMTTNQDPKTGGHDSVLYKLDATGALLWSKEITGTADDSVNSVAVDANGNVYAAGDTDGALAGSNAGEQDAFVRKYDADGVVVWTRQFGTPLADVIWSVRADADGNSYVAGGTAGPLAGPTPTSEAGFLRKYDADGTLQWTQQCSIPEQNRIRALALAPNGNVYGAGTLYVPEESTNAMVVRFDIH